MKNATLLRRLSSIVCVVLLVQISFGQTQSIITASSTSTSQLNSGQQEKFGRLSGSSRYDACQFVQVQNLSTCQVNSRIRLSLSGLACNDVIFTAQTVNYTSENDYYWYGFVESPDDNNPCNIGTITLMAKDGEKFGNINIGDQSYDLQDLGDGLQAVRRFKHENVGSNSCHTSNSGGSYRVSDQPKDKIEKRPSNSGSRIIPCSPPGQVQVNVVRVLVLFTYAARQVEANLLHRAYLNIARTNQIYENSQINTLRLQFAGIEVSSINETGSINADVQTLASSPIVRSYRAQHQADIVVMFTQGNYSDALGTAATIGPSAQQAYAIVETDASSGTSYFAHEVGHLFGARHNDDPTPGIAHGFDFMTGGLFGWFPKIRVTVMGGASSVEHRLDYFSNPDVYWKGHVLGTSNYNNNSQVHRNNAATVANFLGDPMGINIVQDNPNTCCTSITAEAEVYCGTAPFVFNWVYSYDGGPTTLLPNSEIVTFNTACDKNVLAITLSITDAVGRFAEVTRYYNANCYETYRTVNGNNNTDDKNTMGRGKTGLSVQNSVSTNQEKNTALNNIVGKTEAGKVSSKIVENIYPNPASSFVQVEVNANYMQNVKIDVIDVMGTVRKVAFSGTLERGAKTIKITGLTSGTYRLRVLSNSATEYYTFLIVK